MAADINAHLGGTARTSSLIHIFRPLGQNNGNEHYPAARTDDESPNLLVIIEPRPFLEKP
jgi:hypothetical protein